MSTVDVCFEGSDGLDYIASLQMTSEGSKGSFEEPAESPEWEIQSIEADNLEMKGPIPPAAWSAFLTDAIEETIFEKADRTAQDAYEGRGE